VTEPHDDRTPVEHDPTGMRALLANLPDPGPMPEHLVARITAALAAEADAVSAPPADGAPPASGSIEDREIAPVVPLAPRRGVRMRHLGVAAAVVGALGLTGVVLTSTGDGLTASIGAARDTAESAPDAQSDAGGDAGGSAGGAESPATSPLVPPVGSGEVRIVMSGRAYAANALPDGVNLLVEGTDEDLPSLAAEAPGIGPIGTPVGARTCATALGVPSDAGLLVDLATVDGQPAAVIVVDAGEGHVAYAVDRFCTTGTAGLISGPQVVD
jgi:hypothetical protein